MQQFMPLSTHLVAIHVSIILPPLTPLRRNKRKVLEAWIAILAPPISNTSSA